MSQRTRIGIVAVAAALVGFAAGVFYARQIMGPAPYTSEHAPRVVRIGTFSTAIDYAPYIVARSKGWIDDALSPINAKADYTEFQTLPSINEALAGSKIDFVFEAEPPAIVARAAGNDVKVIALSCTLTVEAIVPTASAAQSLTDLKGRKVAVLAGTGAHYGLISRARAAGLAEGDLVIMDMIPPDAKVAFSSGQVDAWAVWPPWPEQEIVSGAARVLPGTSAPIHSILVARSDVLHEKDGIASRVVEAIDRAKEWIIANPADAQSIVASELKLPPEVVKLAWPRHNWSATFTPDVIMDFQAKADFLVAQKFINNRIDVKADLISAMGKSR